jgi:hypothetical protein
MILPDKKGSESVYFQGLVVRVVSICPMTLKGRLEAVFNVTLPRMESAHDALPS